MGLKDNLKELNKSKSDPRIGLFMAEIDRWFVEQNKNRPFRPGMFHASSIINDKFCLRESYWDLMNPKEEKPISPNLLRIFAVGNDAHAKYQRMFKDKKIALFIEQPFFSKFLQMTGTPDAIINFHGKRTGVEIKTMNTNAFYHMDKPHPSAFKQAQMYMYLLGIPQFIIFCENKNDQNIKLFLIDFDLNVALKYVRRMRSLEKYINEGKVPRAEECFCDRPSRRKSCKYHSRCFGGK
jgi:hypothetical protein